jgi:formate dehydrogenase maturation protein FdhE
VLSNASIGYYLRLLKSICSYQKDLLPTVPTDPVLSLEQVMFAVARQEENPFDADPVVEDPQLREAEDMLLCGLASCGGGLFRCIVGVAGYVHQDQH